jgi:thiamine monophosphate synthase
VRRFANLVTLLAMGLGSAGYVTTSAADAKAAAAGGVALVAFGHVWQTHRTHRTADKAAASIRASQAAIEQARTARAAIGAQDLSTAAAMLYPNPPGASVPDAGANQ